MLTMLAHPGVYLEPYEGGYVFAWVFWEIYYTEPALYPEDFHHHTYLKASDSNPHLQAGSLRYAIESYRDHERYGKPYRGGSKDQPYVWKLALACVNDAINAARAQAYTEARQSHEE